MSTCADPIYERFPPRQIVRITRDDIIGTICGHRYSRSGKVNLLWVEFKEGRRCWFIPLELAPIEGGNDAELR